MMIMITRMKIRRHQIEKLGHLSGKYKLLIYNIYNENDDNDNNNQVEKLGHLSGKYKLSNDEMSKYKTSLSQVFSL